MKIVVDREIPYARDYFSRLGQVELADGRGIDSSSLAGADMLIVRSITRVGRSLLEGSPVKFVGSVTSGTDHIDRGYLAERGIGFADAKGSNARAVAEYVLSSLLVILETRDRPVRGMTAAIIGHGNVGRIAGAFLEVLGIECMYFDPPLQQQTGDDSYCSLDDIFSADIISLHVPLVTGGEYPTLELLSRSWLQRLKDDVIIINTSRGEVANEADLLEFLHSNARADCVIDVWGSEPDINPGLLTAASLGTAHIAGYSLDAKLGATRQVCRSACAFLDREYGDDLAHAELQLTLKSLELNAAADLPDLVRMAVHASYDVRTDSGALHAILDMAASERRGYFDELRNNYRIRREFAAMSVSLGDIDGTATDTLHRLGFSVVSQ